ncbi:MAG: peptide chain release factor 1 [Chloroflexi bacterium]|nr:peptide chain release factor 1 [Chloroflexota bacterium]
MKNRLQAIAQRHSELERMMADPEVVSDSRQRQKIGREYAGLQRIVTLTSEFEKASAELSDLKELLAGESDQEVVEMAREESAELEQRTADLQNEIEIELLPKDAAVHADAIVEIRAGAGGDEAGLFAAELVRMYQRYSETRGWKFSIQNSNETGVGGIKEAIFQVQGGGAYSRLKLESGVHRVQRVPVTESQGRIHTSTATVAVLPKAEEIDIEIKQEDLRIDVYHSGGAGGQNVNKVATAIRITHEPSGIVVQAQKERSQNQNRQVAMEELRARLWDQELKKQQDEISANRRAQVGSGDRSEKIRTYNFPQGRVTDHRIHLTSHNLAAIMEGDIDEFIDALISKEQALKLAAVTADG